jgi:hypothetical protein
MATREARRRLREPLQGAGQFSSSLLYLPHFAPCWQQRGLAAFVDPAKTSRLLKEETVQERPMESSTSEGEPGTGATHPSAVPLFVDFEALAHRQNALFEGLTPVHEKAAMVSFIGAGITDSNRYENAAAAFNQLRLMAPIQEGALIQVFTHKLHEESQGSDFLYLHFAGDPLPFGFLICALTGGGLMAGWKLR